MVGLRLMQFNETKQIIEFFALELGLLFMVAWFLILLLIIREFRHFAVQMNGKGGNNDNKSIEVCQESIEQALSYSARNKSTLNDLGSLQQELESQLTELKASTSDHISDKERSSMNTLNGKLKKAHKLIKKLRGDLDFSVNKLKGTRKKLFEQYDSIDSLKKENSKLQDEFERLEKEYEKIASSSAPDAESGSEELNAMKKTLMNYKNQMSEQEQVIAQLMEQNDKQGGEDVKSLQETLDNVQAQLQNTSKEKDFIEKKYLELVEQLEKKPPQ